MSSIFRMATTQAIKDIVQEHAVEGRFGFIVTEESMDEISKKVVDLFEMTLELRAKTREIFGDTSASAPKAAQRSRAQSFREQGSEKEPPPFPSTRNAAEIYDSPQLPASQWDKSPQSLSHSLEAALPRTRVAFSQAEKDRLSPSQKTRHF